MLCNNVMPHKSIHFFIVFSIWQMIVPLTQLINALNSLKNSVTGSARVLHKDFPAEHSSFLREVN